LVPSRKDPERHMKLVQRKGTQGKDEVRKTQRMIEGSLTMNSGNWNVAD
jgi:hypothetical protein